MTQINLDGYKRQLHTINMKKMIIFSLILMVIGTAFFVGLNLLFAPKLSSPVWWVWLAAVVVMFFLFFLHEILHAFSFIVFGKAKTKDIKFGGNIQQGMLYCTCVKPLKKSAYIITILFPFIVTLLGGIAVSLFQGYIVWPIITGILLSGCAGDIMMAYKVSKLRKNSLMLDHPTAPAYYELCPADNLPDGFIEATPEQEASLDKEIKQYQTANTKTNRILGIILLGLFCVLIIAIVVILVLHR